MKYVFRTVVFHVTCILFFGYIYTMAQSGFSTMKGGDIDVLDCFFLSTTIQSGVGYALIRPITHFNKIIIMLQQCCMLSANVFLLYVLTQF